MVAAGRRVGGRRELPELSAPADYDYGFRLDDDDVRPARPAVPPATGRCRWPEPDLRPSTYQWGDQAWTGRRLAGSLIYEMHIGTFTPDGTLDSAIEKLDYLVTLGVDMVELLPVNGFAGVHNWGYDGVLWFAVQETYGGPGPTSGSSTPAINAGSASSRTSSTTTSARAATTCPDIGPYLNEEGPQSTWGESMNLDGPDSGEVPRYILDNVLMWLREYHVDGLRLDAVHALIDTHAVHLLEEIAIEVDVLSAHVRPAADADRRVGPERPETDHAQGGRRVRTGRRSGTMTSTTSCTSR